MQMKWHAGVGTDYICVKDSGWKVMSVYGNTNADYGGLERREKHSCEDETRGNKETAISPGAFSSSADLILPCEYPNITSYRASGVTGRK